MGENGTVKGHEVCNMAVPQDLASIKPLVQPSKLPSVIFMEVVHRRGCPVVCCAHGMVQVMCKDAGSASQEWWE